MLWFLNHDHIYTCGTNANRNEILSKTNIPILQTNRGGKTTYHGPGQRIVYFMINLIIIIVLIVGYIYPLKILPI